MSSKLRRSAATIAVAACAFAAATAVADPAYASHPAGAIGAGVTIARAQDLPGGHPYDLATSANGTAYFAWIGSDEGTSTARAVHLCTLPVAATTCSGGVQTIPTGGTATADDLYVLATGNGVDLVWFHDTPNSINGPQGSAIAEATATSSGHLSAGHDIYSAPSNGDLVDAELTPGGSLWTVTYEGVGKLGLQVHAGSATYTKLMAPFNVSQAQLGFTGTTAVLALAKYGSVSTPAAYSARGSNGAWSRFASVAHTWTTGGLTLKGTGHGLRLITGVNDASYRPVLAAWNGTGFNARTLTADSNNCAPSSHDSATDASKRLVDASWECNDITLADYADGAHAAIVRVRVAGTPTDTPQVGESTNGIASVAWSVEDAKGGSVLRISRVRLATASHTVGARGSAGNVYVTGPVNCLTAADARVGVSGRAARGWKLAGRSLTLGSTAVGSVVDGAALAPHTTYALHGTATFARGTERSSTKVTLTFTTC